MGVQSLRPFPENLLGTSAGYLDPLQLNRLCNRSKRNALSPGIPWLAQALKRDCNEGQDPMTTITGSGRVEFSFFRRQAKDVQVVGDFNNEAGPLSMKQTSDGWWIAVADLGPGEYRFRYIADGQLFADYASHGVELRTGIRERVDHSSNCIAEGGITFRWTEWSRVSSSPRMGYSRISQM